MPREYTTNTEIHKDIKDLRGDIRSLRKDIAVLTKNGAVLEEHLQPFIIMTKKHERIIEGENGEVGMKSLVKENSQKLSNIQWWFRGVMVAILGDLGARLFKFFVEGA